MKKQYIYKSIKIIKLLSILLLIIISLTNCQANTNQKNVKVIIPTGTPSLGLLYSLDKASIKPEIVLGTDALLAGFNTNDYDIIVAPINLGLRLYNTNPDKFVYYYYKTFVWGNFYLASLKEFSSLNDLNNQTILVFSQNSVCDSLIKALINYYNLNINLTYVDDVATANTYLLTNKAEFIITAEPSLSVIKTKKKIYTLDLQTEWQKLSTGLSFPQASIFIKKQSINNQEVLNLLNQIELSIENIDGLINEFTRVARSLDTNLNNINYEQLIKAIPNCHFKIEQNEQVAIEFYINKLINLNQGNTVGNKVPDELFYYQK